MSEIEIPDAQHNGHVTRRASKVRCTRCSRALLGSVYWLLDDASPRLACREEMIVERDSAFLGIWGDDEWSLKTDWGEDEGVGVDCELGNVGEDFAAGVRKCKRGTVGEDFAAGELNGRASLRVVTSLDRAVALIRVTSLDWYMALDRMTSLDSVLALDQTTALDEATRLDEGAGGLNKSSLCTGLCFLESCSGEAPGDGSA